MILLDQHWGLDIVSGFPCVITFGVSPPLHEVLQPFLSPMTLVIMNCLDLVLLIITNEVWWQSGVVFAMFDHFDVRG